MSRLLEGKVAVVTGLAAFAKVTLPCPLNLAQVLVTVAPAGSPSSLTTPCSKAPAGNVMAAFTPALTVGGRFVGGAAFTVIVTSLDADNNESLAVSRRT